MGAVGKNWRGAVSRKPPTPPLGVFNQPPLFGIFLRRLGNSASRKNGAANVPEKTSAPVSNWMLLNCFESAIPAKPPRNGATQVKLTMLNDSAMKITPL